MPYNYLAKTDEFSGFTWIPLDDKISDYGILDFFSLYQSPPESLQDLTITHTSYMCFPALLLNSAFHHCFSCRDDMIWFDVFSGLLLCSCLRREQGCKVLSFSALFKNKTQPCTNPWALWVTLWPIHLNFWMYHPNHISAPKIRASWSSGETGPMLLGKHDDF